MGSAAQRMYYAMLSGTTALPVSNECLPYTMPDHLSVDVDLSQVLTLTSRLSVNINLCEELL